MEVRERNSTFFYRIRYKEMCFMWQGHSQLAKDLSFKSQFGDDSDNLLRFKI